MSILIHNWTMKDWEELVKLAKIGGNNAMIGVNSEVVELPPHGRLIDADKLREKMYHESFEIDSPLQRWDSGCWIRYMMFEQAEKSAPTIVPPEGVE